MELGVFINQAFYNFNGCISTDLSFIRFIESFDEKFSGIKIFAPARNISSSKKQGLYSCIDTVSLCPLPYYENVKDLIKNAHFILPRTIAKLKNEMKGVDRLWIVGPHPLGILAGFYAKKFNIPSFLHIRGNILNDVTVRYNNSMIGKIYSKYMHWSNCFLSKRMTALTVGSELYSLYKDEAKKISWISPSLIDDHDLETTQKIMEQRQAEDKNYITLLFVGRVEPEKGLDYLFTALKDLNTNSNNRYKLVIVGGAQRGSEGKEAEIRQLAKRMDIEKYITWKGYVPYGDEIKKIYRSADIFVLPSLAEGIPKVIYEAMAFGIPIISTKVGGICDIIENYKNGVLIKPKSKEEIVSAIKLIAENTNFQKNLIENGLADAKLYTIEEARKRILSAMNIK